MARLKMRKGLMNWTMSSYGFVAKPNAAIGTLMSRATVSTAKIICAKNVDILAPNVESSYAILVSQYCEYTNENH